MSYLASNIICNTSRILKIISITGIRFSFSDNIIIPVISALCSMQTVSLLEKPLRLERVSIAVEPVIFTIAAGFMYLGLQKLIHNITDSSEEISVNRVDHKL